MSLLSFSQIADTLMLLPEYEKVALKLDRIEGFGNISTVDSTSLSFSINDGFADILQASSSLMVRNYGPGYSVSVSQRGLSTAHTPIYWEGLNLNSPTTGVGDLSLIPTSFVQSLAINNTGNSASFGSGTIAGGIHINPNSKHQKESIVAAFTSNVSSLQNLESSFNFGFVKNRWRISTVLVNDYSSNRFHYVNNAIRNNPTEIREHSSFAQKGWMQAVEKSIGRHDIKLNFWLVETNRDLAPSLTASDNDERQKDFNLKLVLAGSLNYSRTNIQIQTGWLQDVLNYQNGSGIYSNVISNQLIFNVDGQHSLSKSSKLLFGTNNSLQSALAQTYYKHTENQIALSLYAGIKQTFCKSKLEFDLLLRQNYYQNFNHPFSPSLGFSYRLTHWISLKSSIARNYRIPGFNDRFWVPGGSSDLNPEDSWVIEIGPSINLDRKGNHQLQINVFLFHQKVKNWIQWIPGQEYWYAVNYKAVKSTGVQLDVNGLLNYKSVKIKSDLSYVYTDARNISSTYSTAIAGTYLVHVPAHRGFISTAVNWKQISLVLDGNYTGSRFLSITNDQKMESFYLMNAGIGYLLEIASLDIAFKFKVHNLLNTNYQVMPWMPMPLRNYSVGIKLFFKSKT